MNRLDWLKARKSGIGGSDAPCVAGVSSWGTPLDIYLSKVKPINPDHDPDADMTEQQRMGHVMEPIIARLYAKEMGMALRKPPAIIRHPQLNFMFASLDFQRAEDGIIVECKNKRSREGWGESQSDQVPIDINIQVQHQMECADVEEAHVAVLFSGHEFDFFIVERDYEVGAMLIDIENRFWQHVVNRIPPEPDWAHPNTPKLIKKLYQTVEQRTIALGDEAVDLVEQYQSFAKHKIESEEAANFTKARLLALMGEASEATLPNGLTLTRKTIERASYVMPASTYVDFRIKKPSTKKPAKERTVAAHE